MVHPEFADRRDVLWETFKQKDYLGTIRLASEMIDASLALDAMVISGMAIAFCGQPDRAFEWCCAGLSLGQPTAENYLNVATAFMAIKDYSRAMVFLQRGLDLFPDDMMLNYRCGLCMSYIRQWDAALRFLDRSIELGCNYGANMTKGVALRMLNRYEEAAECFDEAALEAKGVDYEEIINNHIALLMEQADHEGALAMFDRCRDPVRPRTLFNKALLYLGLGKWPEAWDLYRHRLVIHHDSHTRMRATLPPSVESLSDLEGKRLIFLTEQGLGDAIQFIRYAPLLRPYVRSMTVCVLTFMGRLARSLDMDDFDVRIIGQSVAIDHEIGECGDVTLSFMDAPRLLQQRTDNIPAWQYFKPVPDSLVAARSIRSLCRPNRPHVGLVWAGGKRDDSEAYAVDLRRSIPFQLLADRFLSQFPDVDFVSLQQTSYQRVDDERVIQPVEDTFDLLDTAAIIEQLDLVISVDTAVAHLAAAFGKPTWLLSRFDGCWRWFYDRRESSPWYPTMRIFHQQSPGDWRPVLRRVARELANAYT